MRSILQSRFAVLLAVCLIGCATAASSMSDPNPKSPSAPRLALNAQSVEVVSWTVPVSAATLASYNPGQKISIDGGATYSAIVGLTCTGTTTQNCSAPFPSTVKGTYQTKIQICDTQGAKTKCATSPTASIDFLPPPATPGAPTCPNCAPAPTGTIALARPLPGTIIGAASEFVITFTGAISAPVIEVRAVDGTLAQTLQPTGQGNVYEFQTNLPALVANGPYDLIGKATGAAATAPVRISVTNSTVPGSTPPSPTPTPTPIPVAVTIVTPAASATMSGITGVTFDTVGVVFRAELNVVDRNDQFVCTCPAHMVGGAVTGQRWLVQLDTAKAINESYGLIAIAYDGQNNATASLQRRVSILN